jgi:homogentisate 1,2-dioxygenase
VPYKYDLTKFVNVGSISVDHIDPSIFCVLTAKSRDATAPLADLLIFSPRWDVASRETKFLRCKSKDLCRERVSTDTVTMLIDTYRPPYYHRNAASELMGLIYGDYGGRSDEFQPGSISFECGSLLPPARASSRRRDYQLFTNDETCSVFIAVVPHGVAYEQFKAATESFPPEMRISEASIAFMFESSRPFTITDYAWNSDKKHEHEPKMWDNLVDNFSGYAKEVDEILAQKVKKLGVGWANGNRNGA